MNSFIRLPNWLLFMVFDSTNNLLTKLNHHILHLIRHQSQNLRYFLSPILLLLSNRRPNLSVLRIRSNAIPNHFILLLFCSILQLEYVQQRPEIADVPVLRQRASQPHTRLRHEMQTPEELASR